MGSVFVLWASFAHDALAWRPRRPLFRRPGLSDVVSTPIEQWEWWHYVLIVLPIIIAMIGIAALVFAVVWFVRRKRR